MSEDSVSPRGGQVWEALDDCEVLVDYVFAAPAGGGGKAILPKGERVIINKWADGIDRKGIAVGFSPVRYEDLHEHFVPADVRNSTRYTNYALDTKTACFNKHFKLVEDLS